MQKYVLLSHQIKLNYILIVFLQKDFSHSYEMSILLIKFKIGIYSLVVHWVSIWQNNRINSNKINNVSDRNIFFIKLK